MLKAMVIFAFIFRIGRQSRENKNRTSVMLHKFYSERQRIYTLGLRTQRVVLKFSTVFFCVNFCNLLAFFKYLLCQIYITIKHFVEYSIAKRVRRVKITEMNLSSSETATIDGRKKKYQHGTRHRASSMNREIHFCIRRSFFRAANRAHLCSAALRCVQICAATRCCTRQLRVSS